MEGSGYGLIYVIVTIFFITSNNRTIYPQG